MSAIFFGTDEPERDTVVPICLAVVMGMIPAQMGRVIPAFPAAARKRRKLLRAATAWLQETGCPLQPRMDVAAVTIEEREGRELICAFEYYEGAFDGGEYG